MAEIILPPEENEETPQVPELNVEKPSENSKIITIEFEAKKTNKVSTKDTNQQLYTTDTDAWFEFKETSLEGANGTYSVVFRNRHDGSIFQRTGDVVGGVAYYKIPHQEIRHAGAWRGQIVYTLSNGDTTSREFDYDVKGHILDGKDVREIVVEDFETLMSQLRSMKDNAEQELAGLVNTANQNETDRQVFFDDLVEDIDELQANYQELLDTGVLQTNINTKLEALEEEYAPKLTEVTAQLAQTVTYLNNKRDKSVTITLDDLDSEVITAIEGGEGTSFELLSVPREKSVRPVSTTFMDVSSNLFNKDDPTKIEQSNIDENGELVESATQNVFDYQPIKPNTVYTVSHTQNVTVFYDKDFNFISRRPTTLSRTFTTANNVYYVRLVIQNAHLDVFQLNEGNQQLPYEPFYERLPKKYLDFEYEPVGVEDVENSVSNGPLIYGDRPIVFDLINKSVTVPVAVAIFFRNTRIRLPEGLYDFSEISGFHHGVYFSEERNTIEIITVADVLKDSEYMRDKILIAHIDMRNLKVHAYGNYLVEGKGNEEVSEANHVFSLHDIVGDYTPLTIKAIDGSDEFDKDTITSNEIYGRWNALYDKYPEYISRELIGNDESGQYPIYSYSFKPEAPEVLNGADSNYLQYPKYLITGGIHGDGQLGDQPNMVFSLLYLFEDICNNWKENEILEYFRWYVNFEIIPITNPWGFNHKSRGNSNGVDLGRNFDNNWFFGNEGTPTYSGTSAFSEVESQYMRDFIVEHSDALLYIDIHTTGGNPTQDKIMYFGMHRESELHYPARDFIKRMSVKWNKRDYAGLDTSMDIHGYNVVAGNIPGAASWAFNKVGIPATVIEGFPNFIGSELSDGSLDIMEMNKEELGNWIWYSLKYFSKK